MSEEIWEEINYDYIREGDKIEASFSTSNLQLEIVHRGLVSTHTAECARTSSGYVICDKNSKNLMIKRLVKPKYPTEDGWYRATGRVDGNNITNGMIQVDGEYIRVYLFDGTWKVVYLADDATSRLKLTEWTAV